MENIKSVTLIDIKQKTIDNVKEQLIKASTDFTQDEFDSFIDWMKVEYINFMLITRNAALKTLHKLRIYDESFSPLIEVLENNINDYAALQCFYIVSLDNIKINN